MLLMRDENKIIFNSNSQGFRPTTRTFIFTLLWRAILRFQVESFISKFFFGLFFFWSGDSLNNRWVNKSVICHEVFLCSFSADPGVWSILGFFSFMCHQLSPQNTPCADERETPAKQIQLEVSRGLKVYLHTFTCVNYRPPGWKCTLFFHAEAN